MTNLLLIGCGGIADAHVGAMINLKGKVTLLAAADPSEKARLKIKERLQLNGELAVYADYQDMLKDFAAKADGVIITTPPFLHLPIATEMIRYKLPILMEKPSVMDLDGAKALTALSQRQKVTVMIGQTRRFTKEALWLRSWIKDNPEKFGRLSTFALTGVQCIKSWLTEKEGDVSDFWALDKKRAGGGVVMSVLIHQIDLLRYLFNEDYTKVCAVGDFKEPFRNGAESSVSAIAKTTGGASGTILGNYLAERNIYCEGITGYGEHGIVATHPDQPGTYMGEFYYGTATGKPRNHMAAQWEGLFKVNAEGSQYLKDPFANQLLFFIQSIADGVRPPSDIIDNFNTIACIDAIYKSMENDGAWEEVEQVSLD